MNASPTDRPNTWEWAVMALFLFVPPAFGALVVYRSAGMEHRHTDFDVYSTAAWAARAGHDIYDVTNADGLHYCYPPPFAVLMAPFAEPPDPALRGGYSPFIVSVTIWYALSCVFLFAAAHLLACAAERGSRDRIPTGCRRWWALRAWPLWLSLPAIGNTLSHGQVNLLVLFLVAAFIAALVAGRSTRSGAWLAAAASIKVIPAFLLLIPLGRRDRRCLTGFAAWLAALLFVVPACVLGPAEAWRVNRKFVDVMLKPALAENTAADRAEEMFHVLHTDNQSIQAVLHAWQHWGDDDAPPQPGHRTRLAHWLTGAALTVIAFRTRGLFRRAAALTFVMLLVSPMCHLHYYCLTMPLVTALLHDAWVGGGRLWPGAQRVGVLALHLVGAIIPLLFEPYRNLGFAPVTTLPLWWVVVRAKPQAARQTIGLRTAA